MEKLVKMHKEFITSVIYRCILDKRLKNVRREMNNVMEFVL